MRTSILHTCFHLPPSSLRIPLLSLLAVKQGCGQELYMSGGCMSKKTLDSGKEEITMARTNNFQLSEPIHHDSLALLIVFFLVCIWTSVLMLLLLFLAWPHSFLPLPSSYPPLSTSTSVFSVPFILSPFVPMFPLFSRHAPCSHLG